MDCRSGTISSCNDNPYEKLLGECMRCSDSAFPGGVVLAAKDGQIFLHKAFGYHTYDNQKPVTRGSIFDLASITKVIATTSAVMKLVEADKISLEDKVVTYLPSFKGKQKEYFDKNVYKKRGHFEEVFGPKASFLLVVQTKGLF